MASCNVCQMQGLEWSENVNSQGKHYLYSETGPHTCKPVLKPNPIDTTTNYVIETDKNTKARTKMMLGFFVELREERIASMITAEEMRCGIKPGKAGIERKGDFIIIH